MFMRLTKQQRKLPHMVQLHEAFYAPKHLFSTAALKGQHAMKSNHRIFQKLLADPKTSKIGRSAEIL